MVQMHVIKVSCTAIRDWDSFHAQFKAAFGFPEYYGMNMDAWIDCMSSLDAEEGQCSFRLTAGERLVLVLEDSDRLARELPDIYRELVACTAIVNERMKGITIYPFLNLEFQ